MTYGSESECATHYTTVPHDDVVGLYATSKGDAASPSKIIIDVFL